MATSRKSPKNTSSARRSTPEVAASPPAPKPAPEVLASRDPAQDTLPPDAPVGQLITRAQRLANDVRTLLAPLSRAKVSLEHAAQLDALAQALADAESAWQTAWAKGAPGAVAKSRRALLTGRTDLAEALRVFADHDESTQSALDAIAGVEDDDDLAADVARLIPLAQKHAADLDGTEISPAHVDGVASALKAFGAARAGAREVSDGSTTAQALSEAARQARARRNRAFWELAALTRTVIARGRFAFRHDPERRGLFFGYVRASRAAKPPKDAPKP